MAKLEKLIDLWRRNIVAWAESQFILPETGRPIKLEPHQKKILRLAFTPDEGGRLPYETVIYSAPKKSGKTTIAALITLWYALTQGRFNEIYMLANDEEQAKSRAFQDVARAVEANPLLAASAKVTQNRIEFSTGTFIAALASEYAGAAGSRHGLTVWDELWAYTSERSRRLWDEMTPIPTRKNSIRLVVTYAGFEGESELLWDLYKQGLAGERIDEDLPIYVNGRLFMYWDHRPRMPWQTPEYYAEQRKSLRTNAYLRLHENRWVSGESAFVDMDWWDTCVDPTWRPLVADQNLPVYLGIDASVKRDSAAVVACAWDSHLKKVRLVFHRVFQPSPQDPLDLEDTLEATVLELKNRFSIREARYDPYQFHRSATTLTKAGVNMVEFPQSTPNLTAASQNLYELIKGGNLIAYPDDGLRLAVQRAVALETPRGWKITKEKSSHKIDVVIALAQAALGAVESGPTNEPLPPAVRRLFHSASLFGAGGPGSDWSLEQDRKIIASFRRTL
ncbi:MAG: hypothetical protein K6U04_08965 [Armatimonadetes bacterium]|nr:hypothetical protein [Armatimonadota bacterium]